MRPFIRALTLLLGVAAQPAFADDLFDGGKLLATGGVSQVEGAGGGGLANWALITGYGTRSEGFVAELMNAISRQLDKGA